MLVSEPHPTLRMAPADWFSQPSVLLGARVRSRALPLSSRDWGDGRDSTRHAPLKKRDLVLLLIGVLNIHFIIDILRLILENIFGICN